MSGIFTISLDFELHWGGFDKWNLQGSFDYNAYFKNTRDLIPEMLSLFASSQVHVTWATVGMLFHQSRQALIDNSPKLKPAYKELKLSAYHYIAHEGIGANEEEDSFHFAATLIDKIIATPHQEMASHTFAHYYCNEEGQTVDQFREDLKAAQRAAAGYGKTLKSLVFPRNQFNDQYLKVCFDEGITSVRSNPLDWFWHIESTQRESAWKRLNRGLDAYLPLGKKNTYALSALQQRDGLPLCIPASRLLRPYNPKEYFLNALKISRIKSEMTRAARQGEIYHLWWHPHNFGRYPQQSMTALKEIIEHYAYCQHNWGMQSLTMEELTERVNHG